MLKPWEFWTLTVIALLAAIFAGANMVLFTNNRATQAEVAGRQDYIQKSVQFEGLYREMVKRWRIFRSATLDQELRGLLANHGISVTLPPPAPAIAPASPPARK